MELINTLKKIQRVLSRRRKAADLVILDKDILYTIDQEEIETIKVLETIKEGNTIFKA